MQVLVVNAGSSSLKYAVVDAGSGQRLISGLVERIGEEGAAAGDHRSAFAFVRAAVQESGAQPRVVGHRVVHGGERFTAPTVITDDVVAGIADCIPLAPLHNPAALAGIAAAREEYPDLPQVAVFDTAFHATMPPDAYTYALDRDVAQRYRLRRYGFHGTSHRYVSRKAADLLGASPVAVDVISLHLGNGASACAVRGGRSVDTSMGVTPLAGLVMGTRSGDIDPAIPVLLQQDGWSAFEVDTLLNRSSGLLGIGGANDMREIHQRAAAGDGSADLARRVFAHRIRHYLGAYLAVLGGADAIVFTAGIGEHDAWTREAVCAGLARLGVVLDPAANSATGSDARVISAPDSPTTVFVIPTDEEWAIAAESAEVTAD